METKAINTEMNIRGSDKFKSIFESEKTDRKNKIEKINKQLSKLDRDILEMQDKYASLLLEKEKLVKDFNKGVSKDARN